MTFDSLLLVCLPAPFVKAGGSRLGIVAAFIAVVFSIHGAEAASPRQPWVENRIVGSPEPPAPYKVRRVFPNVSFGQPVDFAFMPGSQRLFVAEQSGKLWSFDTSDERSRPELILDLRKHRRPIDGILGFAFHPGFATNRYVFINYNEAGARENGAHVSRFTVAPEHPPLIDPASEHSVIRWLSGGHNGCTLAFGNDGFLYVSTGDAADPDPPDGKRSTGQDITDLLASILRIDVDRTEGTNAYSIPRDNPFITVRGARPEVWAFGFRNPYRMSVDQLTGDLWVGDVGWETWEMIHRVVAGGNYGWPIVEGPNTNVRRDVQPGPGPILAPVIAIPHTQAASITGGLVYWGQRLNKLTGAYVYGDWETGKFWALRHDKGALTSNVELCDTSLKPVAFALDPAREMLILDYNGGLYDLVPNDALAVGGTFPRQLSGSGLFRSMQPLKPAPGTIPYQIAAPMWSDHATAEWLLGVPGTGGIATTGGVGNIAGSTWFFPSNTVLARTASLQMSSGDPTSHRRIETQLLHWDGQAWNPYSYRWRVDQSDADLVSSGGTNEVFMVADSAAPTGRRATPWRFLGRTECLRCHNAWAGETLTLNFQQLGNPDAPASEAARLVSLGVLSLKNNSRTEALAYPYDDSFPLQDRARSWLHVNCSPCHRFGAGGVAAIHLSLDKLPTEMRAIDVKPLRGDFGLDAARIIASGDPYRSTLFYRILTEGSGRMPHIGSRLVDVEGMRLISSWIKALPARSTLGPDTIAARQVSEESAKLAGMLREDGDRKILDRLLSTTVGSLALLERLHQGTPLSASNRSIVAEIAAANTNALIRELFQSLLPPDQRRHTLGTEINPQVILALTGNANRGRLVFEGMSGCSRCHVSAGVGRGFGPNLDGLARRYGKPQLLAQIIEPTKIIAPEFKFYSITLRDDSELNGFILQRSAAKLVLRDETLKHHELALSEIVEIRESSVSAMPEGLLAPLTAQEAADLLEFLLSSTIAGG